MLNDTNINYGLTRISETFPEYITFSDLDILTNEPDKLVETLLQHLDRYRVRVDNRIIKSSMPNSIHVDVFKKNSNTVDLKFDICYSLAGYTALTNNLYINEALSRCSMKTINQANVRVFSLIDELFLRFLEYYHKIGTQPRKIKHLKFIQETLINTPESSKLNEFLNVIHTNTNIKLSDEEIIALLKST